MADFTPINFTDILQKAGVITEVVSVQTIRKNSKGDVLSDETTSEYQYDTDKFKELTGIEDPNAEVVDGLVLGYYNPTRGANFNAILKGFKLDDVSLRAFMLWRKEKLDAWNEGDPSTNYKDSDWKGEKIDEVKAQIEAQKAKGKALSKAKAKKAPVAENDLNLEDDGAEKPSDNFDAMAL